MSQHLIVGKKGAGKSLTAFDLLAQELVFGRRGVATNLVIDIPKLAKELALEYPKANVDFDRIRFLTRDECYHYWRHRLTLEWDPYDLQAEEVEESATPLMATPKGQPKGWRHMPSRTVHKVEICAPDRDAGMFYVIDEAWEFFGSYDDWREIGREAIFYGRQERKWSDTTQLTSPDVADVCKAFRRLVQDVTYLRNYGKEQMFGFRGPKLFSRVTLQGMATDVSRAPASAWKTFTLPKGLANCYDTNAGVGTGGGRGDLDHKVRGPSWLWLVALGCLAIYACWKAPDWVARGFTAATSSSFDKKVAQHDVKPAGGTVSNAAPVDLNQLVALMAARQAGMQRGGQLTGLGPARGNVEILSFWKTPTDTWSFKLSDGRTLVNPEGSFDGVTLETKTGRYNVRAQVAQY